MLLYKKVEGLKYMYAAIDIGTNSVRLLIAEKHDNIIIPVCREARMTRLGECLSATGRISHEALYRTAEVLTGYMDIICRYNVNQITAVATSAMREASNSQELIDLVEEKTKLKIKIISGEEEAELSYLGATTGLGLIKGGVVIDIGGGSTEIVFAQEEEIITNSTPVGAVRCTENSSTPTQIFAQLEQQLDRISTLENYQLIAVGGTATNLAAINQKLTNYDPDLIHGSQVSIEELGKIIFFIGGKSLAQRLAIPGLQPERADIIIAGLLILWVIMTYLNISTVTISEADLLYGIILAGR